MVKTMKKGGVWKQDPMKLPQQGSSPFPNLFPLLLEPGFTSVFEPWADTQGQEGSPFRRLGCPGGSRRLKTLTLPEKHGA